MSQRVLPDICLCVCVCELDLPLATCVLGAVSCVIAGETTGMQVTEVYSEHLVSQTLVRPSESAVSKQILPLKE